MGIPDNSYYFSSSMEGIRPRPHPRYVFLLEDPNGVRDIEKILIWRFIRGRMPSFSPSLSVKKFFFPSPFEWKKGPLDEKKLFLVVVSSNQSKYIKETLLSCPLKRPFFPPFF